MVWCLPLITADQKIFTLGKQAVFIQAPKHPILCELRSHIHFEPVFFTCELGIDFAYLSGVPDDIEMRNEFDAVFPGSLVKVTPLLCGVGAFRARLLH